MNLQDIIKAEEQIAINRKEVADGIVSVSDEIHIPVEFRVSRWRLTEDEESKANILRIARLDEGKLTEEEESLYDEIKKRPPYLTTRDGKAFAFVGLITNTGGSSVWRALRGDAITAFSNANTRLAIGSSSTAAAAAQTALVTQTGSRISMATSFPILGGESAGGKTSAVREVVFRSTFGSGDGNSDWREFGVFNAATGDDDNLLDRFTSSQGTKVSGQVWELTVDITLT